MRYHGNTRVRHHGWLADVYLGEYPQEIDLLSSYWMRLICWKQRAEWELGAVDPQRNLEVTTQGNLVHIRCNLCFCVTTYWSQYRRVERTSQCKLVATTGYYMIEISLNKRMEKQLYMLIFSSADATERTHNLLPYTRWNNFSFLLSRMLAEEQG